MNVRIEVEGGPSATLEQFIRDRTGLTFDGERRADLHAHFRRTMERLGISDPSRFAARLAADSTAFSALLDEITVGETYFFREAGQFDFIRDHVIPTFAAARPPRRAFRAWSAGCASGEEAYTLAILLRECGLGGAATVIGTDIARSRLRRAREGRFRKWSLRGVPDRTRDTYFRRVGRQWELDPAIRSAVKFAELNLLRGDDRGAREPLREMDLILCRNVLIYLAPAAIAAIADRLIGALARDGWLFLGASDPLLADYAACEVVTTGAGVAYRRQRGGRAGVRMEVTRMEPGPSSAPATSHPTWAPAPIMPEAPPIEAEVPLIAADAAAVAAEETPTRPDAAPTAAEPGRTPDAELAPGGASDQAEGVADAVRRIRDRADRGDLEEAGMLTAAGLERYPESAEMLYLHALLLSHSGNDSEAIRAARRALYLDREFVVAHLMLGGLLARFEDLSGARRSFINAERLLARMEPRESVPAADGETAGALLDAARVQRRLVEARA